MKALQSFESDFKPHTDQLRELSIDIKDEASLAKVYADLQAQNLEERERRLNSAHRSRLSGIFSSTGKELEEIKKLQLEQDVRRRGKAVLRIPKD